MLKMFQAIVNNIRGSEESQNANVFTKEKEVLRKKQAELRARLAAIDAEVSFFQSEGKLK